MNLLQVEDLHVTYQRAIVALDGVSLAVPQGHVTAILGANGAGKSTTLRAISGFIGLDNARITRGRVRFDGQDVAGLAPYRITALGVVLVPERDKVFPNLTVQENLDVVASRLGDARRAALQATVLDHFPRLKTLLRREAGLLSGGERQMLALASAIVCAPRLLLVDELSLGLAPVIVEDIAGRLRALRADLDLTILLVEQSAAVAFRLADHAHVLDHGAVALSGPVADLQGNPAVQGAYLGTGTEGRRSYRDAHLRRKGGEA
jgi:branched-chain amino acid transport system ATP-binding protein